MRNIKRHQARLPKAANRENPHCRPAFSPPVIFAHPPPAHLLPGVLPPSSSPSCFALFFGVRWGQQKANVGRPAFPLADGWASPGDRVAADPAEGTESLPPSVGDGSSHTGRLRAAPPPPPPPNMGLPPGELGLHPRTEASNLQAWMLEVSFINTHRPLPCQKNVYIINTVVFGGVELLRREMLEIPRKAIFMC